MKNLSLCALIVLSMTSLSSFAADYYDCRDQKVFEQRTYVNDVTVLTHHNESRAVDIYNFGGAGHNCRHIALKLNIQKLLKGDAKFYDCENPTQNSVIIKSELGEVVTLASGNFMCDSLALRLNRNL